MLYHLANALQTHISVLNVVHYVSFRSICALLSSLFFSLLFGEWFIKTSQRNFKSDVRPDTPQSHQSKNNTPTMGGLFILMVMVFNTLLWNNLSLATVWIFLACMIGFAAIGFLDDWAKIKRKKGITARHKAAMQFFLSLFICVIWYFFAAPSTELCIPFFKRLAPELGLLLIPWGIVVLIGTSNAVNLTDGLDGLAAGPLIFNFAAFSLICYVAGHAELAHYLYIPFAGTQELAIIGGTFIGTLLGFLWYNTYPAQIFMGDVGSLALGGSLGLMALMARQELLLLLAGGIFVIEALSVIIQVASFKLRGKRIFRMAPIHHHYELLGWTEPKITVRFWIISIVLSLLALLTLKMR